MLLTGLLSVATVLATPTPAQATNADSAGPNTIGWGDSSARLSRNVFYAYVKAGETIRVSASKYSAAGANSNFALVDQAGASRAMSTLHTATADGIWTFTASNPAGVTGDRYYNWNVDVRTGGVNKPGRVWSNEYKLNNLSGATSALLNYWAVNDVGYIYKIDLKNYNGINSIIQASASGNPVSAAECAVPSYKSVVVTGLATTCSSPYRLFFEPPANDLPVSAISASGQLIVMPAPLSVNDLTISDLALVPQAGQSAAGSFSWTMPSRFSGSYTLDIDTNGNGVYTDAVDRSIIMGADGIDRDATYTFDGRDANGDPILNCQLLNARVHFDKLGEIHIRQEDVEGRGGITVNRLNGPNLPSSTLYWDDRSLSTTGVVNQTPTIDGRAGVNSNTGPGVHGWAYIGDSWGDKRSIDDWTYATVDTTGDEIAIGGQCLDLVKTSTATSDTRVGDTVTYTVTATNNGTVDYTEANPAVVLDDLTGVLDDGTLDVDSVATNRGDDPTYVAPKLTWTGALPAGESVELTYEVKLKSGGDGNVRNVAFVPDCVPGGQGCAPETPPTCADVDQPCDEVEFKLPRLSITKTADRTDLPAVGEEVTYTVTVKNEGPGDYTAAAPATFEDDLSDVLDDATLAPADIDASAGTATFTDPQLSWTGALAADDVATVTYTVAYTGAGDKILYNQACIPTSEALDPDAACGAVQIPGSGLVQTKTVDPASGTSVQAGQEVTYTLTFENIGRAAATVDTSDDLTGVIDDAALIAGPSVVGPLTATLNGAGDKIDIGGTVPAGQTRTVTYTVKVKAFADQADHILGNVLACQTGSAPDCEPITTENPIRNLDIEKTSNATANSRPGDVITYTVTATNTGEGDYTTANPAVVLDDLTGVADDGTLDEDSLAADRGGDPTYAEPRITWTGALPAGESVTLTYEVLLKAGGDGQVRNVAFVPNCVPGDSGCNPPTPVCTGNLDPATGLPCDVVNFPLPKLTISKAASKTDLPAVGETVDYTVTVTNEGPGDYTTAAPATFEDDLSAVLDDATLDQADINASVGTATLAGTKLSWTGVLAAGDSATVTYTVMYTGAGNQQLKNLACIPVSEAQDPTDACRTVIIPGSGLLQTKTVDPASGDAVDPGQDITYTLSFENIGGTAATVNTSDDLTGVIDDAELTDGPNADAGLNAVLNGAGDKILITGSVPVDETLTVTYTVKVKAFGDQADHILKNALACQPGSPADCEPETTENPIRHLKLTKVSNAKADANTGDKVTYTLVVTNNGEADYTALDPGTFTDDLTEVLDDARYNNDVTATTGGVSYAKPTLTWTGALAKGASATITYTVTVTNTGDHELRNTAKVPGCADNGCNPPPVVTPLPHIVPAKVSDPESGEAVKAGQVIKYTLTWTNDGKAAGPVDSTDDLVKVLDDGDVTAEPVSSDPDITVTRTADKIRVVGELGAGKSVTVKYEVTVKADGQRGDNIAKNVLTPDVPVMECDADGGCTEVPPPTTEHKIGELDDWKTVDPASGSTVQPGQKVTYTLHFTNTGEAPVAVNRDDVLTQVLDDATLVSEPVTSSGALTASKVSDGRFNVNGSLKVGETVTVSYVVQVKADGSRGDDQLGNFLVDKGQQPPAECKPADDGRADCTVNPVSNVTVVKSSDPKSGDTVKAGQSIVYTLTFTNVSRNAKAAPVDIDYTDHMAGVLDDADLTKGPDTSHAALAATSAGDKIRIVGSLTSGQVVTVNYTVKVKAYDRQGDHALDNVVAVTGLPPLCSADTQLCTSHETLKAPPAPPGNSILPNAGGPATLGMIGLGFLALLGGGGLVLAGRRRREGETPITS